MIGLVFAAGIVAVFATLTWTTEPDHRWKPWQRLVAGFAYLFLGTAALVVLSHLGAA